MGRQHHVSQNVHAEDVPSNDGQVIDDVLHRPLADNLGSAL